MLPTMKVFIVVWAEAPVDVSEADIAKRFSAVLYSQS